MVDLLTVLLLLICICTYVRGFRKGIFDVEDGSHSGLRGEEQPHEWFQYMYLYVILAMTAPSTTVKTSSKHEVDGPV